MHFSKLLVIVSATTATAAVLPKDTNSGDSTETDLNVVSMVWDGVHEPTVANITSVEVMMRSAQETATSLEPRQQGVANGIKVTVNAIAHAVAWAYAAITWDSKRQRFTQDATNEMWKNNPDVRTWAAAICYNKGYRVRDYNRISTPQKQKLKSGFLHTDYDCMFMMGNNAFWTDGDGGYENLAYAYDGSRCSYDGNTGDLTC
ncbi:uncharacterized protein EAF01_002992 [Botrytis porri]|uniref:DUF7888 domain-containing protein n=1 Tax=Botrytis porri TaxID=87229 RepID=A0A4Z1K673_9HELO|nr:uncharacterized protein EAF01_002992 [Botrytis porri]KAF7911485.1 hypothetical protein EAF01_002992 [Botrytis porri]TGO81014.1 hypothetical protein BPOR_1425g00010 [Botrytis porri]